MKKILFLLLVFSILTSCYKNQEQRSSASEHVEIELKRKYPLISENAERYLTKNFEGFEIKNYTGFLNESLVRIDLNLDSISDYALVLVSKDTLKEIENVRYNFINIALLSDGDSYSHENKIYFKGGALDNPNVGGKWSILNSGEYIFGVYKDTLRVNNEGLQYLSKASRTVFLWDSELNSLEKFYFPFD